MEQAFLLAGYGLFFAWCLMVIFWSWGKYRDNYGVVDVGWGIVNPGILWVYFFFSPQRQEGGSSFQVDPGFLSLQAWILLGMISLWGLRLSGFLYWTRIRPGHPEDKRYNAFRKDYGEKVHRKFFTNVFLFQGFLAWILTLPFLSVFLQGRETLGFSGWTGIFLYLAGVIGETLADKQLAGFIKNPHNKGKVCNSGLWKYSRHPNYFFEWVIWMGMSFVALEISYFGILPGIFMYILLVYFTGIPFAEKYSLQSKGDLYREYQRTTNAFFPWFPRK